VETDDANTDKAGRRTSGVGPTGRTIAANVARIRNARGLTVIGLANALADAGHPMPHTGITKIEMGQRRVTAEDLVALAVVLRVNVSALLLPPTTDGETEIVAAGSVPAEEAWRWADGERPLAVPSDDDGSAWNEFQLQARPVGRRNFRAT
jgi:transcriptional regulator with XRE-family HTH domain